MIDDETIGRFRAKTERDGDCLRWTGGLSDTGYGGFQIERGKVRGAHRVAWMIAKSSGIPKGMRVLHSCDNRWCVEPAHLRLGTAKENMADMIERAREDGPAPRNRAKTECPRGHPYDRSYTRKSGQAFRYCSKCQKGRRGA